MLLVMFEHCLNFPEINTTYAPPPYYQINFPRKKSSVMSLKTNRKNSHLSKQFYSMKVNHQLYTNLNVPQA